MPVPAVFAYHTWVVVGHNGTADRFDLMGFIRNGQGERNGHIYKNYHSLTLGCPVLAIGRRTFCHEQLAWPAKVLYTSSGGVDSSAQQAHQLLHEQIKNYPYMQGPFKLIHGPNCNTFTQWVINSVGIPCQLPWGAFGKNAL